MKAQIYLTNGEHQLNAGALLKAGLEKHGWSASIEKEGSIQSDMIVIWGWRRICLIEEARQKGVPILVMERGHLHPRKYWTSLGFNGLAGLASYPECQDDGTRFWDNFGSYMKPWKRGADGYVLVMGQSEGDASLHGLNIRKWEQEACDAYRNEGLDVQFRPHPNSKQGQGPSGVRVRSDEAIETALDGASLCVTYTSTSAVESVLRGVSTVSCHIGSISRPVTSHGLLSRTLTPNRSEWASKLAWSQFSDEEMGNGLAWECLKDVIPQLA